jgi:LAO/AO transport system kinase
VIEELLEGPRPVRSVVLARLISAVERGGEEANEIERAVFPRTGNAWVVGITGAPGAGKSTLTGRMVAELRAGGLRVAVLAVDPSSPFTGGAILGDRVRMLDHTLDDGVFIRSMATRGRLGGLALATPAAARLLDAAGFDVVLLETVGVGQVELEVAGVADATVVVVNPGWGDEVQTAKAGLMEIADVFVVNKADRPGARDARNDLRLMLRTRPAEEGAWTPPILETVATDGRGSSELVDAVWQHRAWFGDRLAEDRADRLWQEVEQLVALRAASVAKERLGEREVGDLRRRVGARELDPWEAAEQLLS